MKRDEISSTEKLLDLIRNDSATGPDFSDRISPRRQIPAKRLPRPSVTAGTKGAIAVGVDFGYHDIRLVKVAQAANQKLKLLDYSSIPLDPKTLRDSPQFADFLRQALNSFCGPPARNLQLWGAVSAASVEVRHLLVPRVARKQLDKTVYWAFKKESPFDEKEVVFDFDVQGDITDKGVKKTAVLAYTAPKKEIEATKALFARSGYPLAGITTAPFALQNLFGTNWIAADAGEVVCNLYIGREWSRIDIFSQGRLVLIRGVKSGINSMAEELAAGLKTRREESELAVDDLDGKTISLSLAPDTQPDDLSPEEARRILFSLTDGGPPLAEKEAGFSIKEPEIFDLMQPAVERLVRQIERTFEHFVATFAGETVRKIYISGPLDTYPRLIAHISEQLGMPCGAMDPFVATVPHSKEIRPPGSAAAKHAFALASGLALSHNSRTPNFLFTYREKAAQARIARIDRGIFAVFLGLAILCGSFFFWQTRQAGAKDSQLAGLRSRLAQYEVTIDRNLILQLTERVKAKDARARAYGKRYLGMAVLGELTDITPENISLASCTILTDPPPGKPAAPALAKPAAPVPPAVTEHPAASALAPPAAGEHPAAPPGPARRTVAVSGMVVGEQHLLDSLLAEYVMRLTDSPLFGQPEIKKSSIDKYQGKEVLNFTLFMELL